MKSSRRSFSSPNKGGCYITGGPFTNITSIAAPTVIASIIKCGVKYLSISKFQRYNRWSLEMDK